ncbi:hypothetical protein SAMN05216236_1235 [Sedimentitalea nanhaiensis]|uniref:Uncharacterized protein n=1 Tax=Sedimentitalea nanhaiensis TaxID=999627 RepID=A0A1I7D4Z4_9RHOB|nr:hypothetical protein [Sedimentitalea nanhaiensis]SFU06759.1 hypothetical protein SAMN05216236_1235 [Sedimentitalea nanhaiensis]
MYEYRSGGGLLRRHTGHRSELDQFGRTESKRSGAAQDRRAGRFGTKEEENRPMKLFIYLAVLLALAACDVPFVPLI